MGYGIEGLAATETPRTKASAHRGAKLRAAMKRYGRRRMAEIFLRASARRTPRLFARSGRKYKISARRVA